jgi:hypothetical protein
MSLSGPLAHELLVDLDAQAGAVRDGDHALVVGEDGPVGLGSPLIGDALTSDGDLGALAERARSVCAAAGTRR